MIEFCIKPANGVTVRDPETLVPLAQTGECKPKNSYWLRRLNDGDVIVVDQIAKKKRGE